MQLFEEFKPVTKAEWLTKIEKDLKGKPLSDLLADFGEIEMGAFHHLSDRGNGATPLPFREGWEIGEDIKLTDDFGACNEQLLAALEDGVNAPRLVLNKNISAENLGVLLRGVNLEMVSLHFYFTNKNASPQSLLPHFLKYLEANGMDVKQANAGFNWEDPNAVDEVEIGRLLELLSQTGNGVKALTVNGKGYFSEEKPVTELVRLISEGERFLHQFSTGKYPPPFIHQHLQFSVSVGKNYFLQIAKMRALRLLWANVMKAYQIGGGTPPIEAHLSPTSQTHEANTNMIAATTQAMSAIIGGADRLTILPADFFSGETSIFSRRIARNVQHILQMESYFDWVADPAAGSYFVEKLTIHLAEKTWEVFSQK